MARALTVAKMRYRKNFHTINYQVLFLVWASEAMYSPSLVPWSHCQSHHCQSHHCQSDHCPFSFSHPCQYDWPTEDYSLSHSVFHHQIKLKNSVPQTHSVRSFVAVERMLWFNWLRFVVVDDCSLHPGLLIVQVPQSLPFSFLNTSRRF